MASGASWHGGLFPIAQVSDSARTGASRTTASTERPGAGGLGGTFPFDSARTGASRTTAATERPGAGGFGGGVPCGLGREELRTELQAFATGVLRQELRGLSNAFQQCLRNELAEALSEAGRATSARVDSKKPPCTLEMPPEAPSPPMSPPPELDETIGDDVSKTCAAPESVITEESVGRWSSQHPVSNSQQSGIYFCQPRLPQQALRQELAEMGARITESLRHDIAKLLDEARSHTSQVEHVSAVKARPLQRPEPHLPLPTPRGEDPSLPDFPDFSRAAPEGRSDAQHDEWSGKSWLGLSLPSQLYARCGSVSALPPNVNQKSGTCSSAGSLSCCQRPSTAARALAAM